MRNLSKQASNAITNVSFELFSCRNNIKIKAYFDMPFLTF